MTKIRLFALVSLAAIGLSSAALAVEESPPAPEDLRFLKRDATPVSEKAIGTPFWMLQAQCAGMLGAASAWNEREGRAAEAERDKNHGVAFYNGAVDRLVSDRKIDRTKATEIAEVRMEYGRAYAKDLLATSGVFAKKRMLIQRSFCMDVEDALRKRRS
jgi:hypothetical protein